MNAIDLGLSVLWADMNVGAHSPVEAGDYFAWGETRARKPEYTPQSYVGPQNQSILDQDDDVATVVQGGTWRMPTQDEFQELLSQCRWHYVQAGAVGPLAGHLVTGPNGNSIFLPLAGQGQHPPFGHRYTNSNPQGWYWSAERPGGHGNPLCLSLEEKTTTTEYDDYNGFSIRPVRPR